jgi:sulfocyanin
VSPPYRHVRHATLIAATITGCLAVSGLQGDPEFMRYDPEARRVELTIVAAYDQANSGYNFNGGFNGSHHVTVPVGWRIAITLVNRDVIPHSFAVIRAVRQLPLRIDRPALPGAASRNYQVGVRAGGREDAVEFAATIEGDYLIACGMTSHAALGSYLVLTISSDANAPTYETGLTASRLATPR